MKRTAWIGAATSLIFLYLAVRNVSLSEVVEAFAQVNVLYAIPLVLIQIGLVAVRAVRWRLLLEPLRLVDLHPLYSAVMIGLMANNLLPARSGEFIRAYVLGRREHLPFAGSFATIVIERVFDGLTLLALLVLVVILYPASPDWFRVGGYLSAAMYLAVLGCLLLLLWQQEAAERVLRRGLVLVPDRLVDRFFGVVRSFIDGLATLRCGRPLALILFWSAVHWGLATVPLYLAITSTGLQLPYLAAVLLQAALAVSVALPSSPGFVGPVQLASVLSLGLFGVPAGQALTVSIVYHLTYFIPITGLGLLYLWLGRLSLTDLTRPPTPD